MFLYPETLPISDEHEQIYLQHIIQRALQHRTLMIIAPRLNGSDLPVAITVVKKTVGAPSSSPDWKSADVVANFSPRLFKLLVWAEQTYEIRFKYP